MTLNEQNPCKCEDCIHASVCEYRNDLEAVRIGLRDACLKLFNQKIQENRFVVTLTCPDFLPKSASVGIRSAEEFASYTLKQP